MTTDNHSASSQGPVATPPVGHDGWITLLLSNLLIILSGGIGLLWLGRIVVRQARNSRASGEGEIQLLLVPGMRLSAGEPNHDYQLRLQRALLLHRQHGCQLLLLGGITGDAQVSEAAAGGSVLRQQGLDPSFLLLEDRSRNTLENLRNAREQLRERGIERYALLSNRYHLARCQALAHGLGMHPTLCGAEEHFSAPPASWPRLLLESYYLHWYHTGKLWSRLTRNRHSLARIS